jgi:hypothetical protein
MRYRAVSTTLFVTLSLLGCANNPPPAEKVGSTVGSGGNSSGGSGSARGGATSSGGSVAPGGLVSSGGIAASGGAVASGGSVAGGSSGSGGASSSGGSSAKGGAGGANGSGGNTSTGACADVAPPSNPCSDWLSWNQCSTSYLVDGHFCDKTCGRCGGTAGTSGSGGGGSGGTSGQGGSAGSGSGGSSGGGGVSSLGSTNPQQITGSSGWASRYWDCCKPSCAWTTDVPSCQKDGTTRITDKNAQSGCQGGAAFECYDFSPWYDASTNMSYGFAAHNGNCGTCYELQFTGTSQNVKDNPGAAALKGQQMIVQAINIGSIGSDQFDLLIPGGGVGDYNGCGTQFGFSSNTQYGGLLSDCNNDPTCMKSKCQSSFGNIPALLAGCNWFTSWYSSAANPNVIYKQVPCPSQITSKSGISG